MPFLMTRSMPASFFSRAAMAPSSSPLARDHGEAVPRTDHDAQTASIASFAVDGDHLPFDPADGVEASIGASGDTQQAAIASIIHACPGPRIEGHLGKLDDFGQRGADHRP